MHGAIAQTRSQGLTTLEVASELGIDRTASALVQVDDERVDRVADLLGHRLDLGAQAPFRWDDPTFWNTEGTAAERSQFFAVGNAINFRFWELVGSDVVRAKGSIEGQEFHGAMYMWRSLRRSLNEGRVDILNADTLATLTEEQFDTIFAADDGSNPLSVARSDRIENLRDLGRQLVSEWAGSFYELARASEGSLVEFARRSSAFRAFDDPLHKLTMVNAIMHAGSEVSIFRDQALPAIDYHLLRQGLRQGMLRPDARLGAKLMASEPVEAHEAYELRRVALGVFVELAARTGTSGQVLDNRYWANRVNCSEEPVCLDPATSDRCPFLDACERRTEIALPLEMTRYY